MDPIHLEPKNSLEVALGQAQIGKVSMPDLLRLIVAADLFIVSVEEVFGGALGLYPLFFDRAGVPMAAIYTDSSRTETAKSQVKAVVRMKGADIFRNTPRGYGIVINPGFDTGLELLPEGVQNIVNNYCVA
jgi:hypothetical protein